MAPKQNTQPTLQEQLDADVAQKEALADLPEVKVEAAPEVLSTGTPVPPPVEVKEDMNANPDKSIFADAARTKKGMEAYPMVPINIPLTPGEKPGAEESATINGHRLTIKKGVVVRVPEPFAMLFMNHYSIEAGDTEFGYSKRADRAEGVASALRV